MKTKQQGAQEQNFSQNLYLANAQNHSTNQTGLIFQSRNPNKPSNADQPFRNSQNYVLSQNLAQSRLTQQQYQQQNQQDEQQPQQTEDIEYLNQIFSQQCIYHPEMAITNFCKESLMPLCPKCITNYLKSRQSNNLPVKIENIEKIQTECKEAVLELEELYAMDIRKLREAKEQKSNLQENLAEKIIFQKNKVLKIVDSFFEGLEKDLSNQLSQKRNNYDKELSMAEGFALQKHQELHAIRMKLDGKKYLKYILRLLSDNFFQESKHYHSECEQFMQLLTKKDVEIFNDDSKLYNLSIELAKFVSIKNSELLVSSDQEAVNFNFDQKNPYAATNYNQPNTTLYAEPQQQKLPSTANQQQQFANQIQKSTNNLMWNNNTKQEPSIIQSPIKGIVQPVQGSNNQQIAASKNLAKSQQPQILSENAPPASQSQQQQQPLIKSVAIPNKSTNSQLLGSFQKQDFTSQQRQLAQPNDRAVVNKNYFEQVCPSKVIHYFQPGTNEFYFIDLNTVGSDAQIPNLKWQYIELDISFKIPNDHATIVTPQGDIYLCGGIDVSNMQVWADCFKLDLKFRTLERKPTMNIPRFLHGLVFLNNALYSLGGFDQSHGLLDKCERLNLSENKWVRTASMIGQSAQMGVCVYKNRYIISFGVATHPKINLIQYYDPLFDVWQEVMLTLEPGLLYSELLVRPQCGVSQINDNGTLLLFGGDETSQSIDQSRYQQNSSQQRVPNNYLFTLKSENEALHFTVGLPKNPFDLYNTQVQGLAYPHNGRLYSTLGQQQDQKIIVFSNGEWIKQI